MGAVKQGNYSNYAANPELHSKYCSNQLQMDEMNVTGHAGVVQSVCSKLCRSSLEGKAGYNLKLKKALSHIT